MSVIGPRPGLWNQDILTAERDKYNAMVLSVSIRLERWIISQDRMEM